MIYKIKVLVANEESGGINTLGFYQQFIPNELLTDIGIYGNMIDIRTFEMDKADAAMLKLRYPNFDRFVSESPDV